MAAPLDGDALAPLLLTQAKQLAMMVLDRDGIVRWWGACSAEVFGFRAEEIVGQPLSRLFGPDEVAQGLPDWERAVADAGTAAEDECWMAGKDGKRFWATGVLFPLHDEHGAHVGYGKILRNETDRKEQLERLRNQVDTLRDAGRRQELFLSTLSHELRNPLAPLTNAAQLIRLVATPSRELETALGIVDRQLGVLRRLVDDLLDIARLGAGKVQLECKPVVLQQVLEAALDATRTLAASRGQRLDVIGPPGPITLHADPTRLQQVFVNLLQNAAKYTPEGGHIWVKTRVEDEEATVAVEDTGIGIPPDMLARIFDMFTQVEVERGQSQGGLGIGLALVRDLVALHGGSVQARSEGAGRGSTFIVRLPLVRGDVA